MVVKPAIVRVQTAWAPVRLSAFDLSRGTESHGLPRGFEQQVIGFVLMIPEQTPQLGRHRESDQEITLDWQQLSAAALQPTPALMLLAVGQLPDDSQGGMRRITFWWQFLTFQEASQALIDLRHRRDGIEGVGYGLVEAHGRGVAPASLRLANSTRSAAGIISFPPSGAGSHQQFLRSAPCLGPDFTSVRWA